MKKPEISIKRKIQIIDALTAKQLWQIWLHAPDGYYLTHGLIGEYLLARFAKLQNQNHQTKLKKALHLLAS